jgi:hypothetical protein
MMKKPHFLVRLFLLLIVSILAYRASQTILPIRFGSKTEVLKVLRMEVHQSMESIDVGSRSGNISLPLYSPEMEILISNTAGGFTTCIVRGAAAIFGEYSNVKNDQIMLEMKKMRDVSGLKVNVIYRPKLICQFNNAVSIFDALITVIFLILLATLVYDCAFFIKNVFKLNRKAL